MKLPYIKAYKDRHGRARCYFRRKGFPTVPLPDPKSPGFIAAYEAANSAKKQTFDTSKIGFLHGSLGWLIDRFVSTKAFNERAPNTWRSDRRIFDELKERFGAGILRDLRPKHVKAIRDHFHRTHSASVADAAIGRLQRIGIRGYSIHGLRKNAAQALAEAGCSVDEIMAITGHRSAKMALRCAQVAEEIDTPSTPVGRSIAAAIRALKDRP